MQLNLRKSKHNFNSKPEAVAADLWLFGEQERMILMRAVVLEGRRTGGAARTGGP